MIIRSVTMVDIVLNSQQKIIVHYINYVHRNFCTHPGQRLIFLSGSAGSGKSCVVRELMKLTNKVVVAKTGIAAHNVSGSTINREFGMDFDGNINKVTNKHKHVKLLIIDEISMVKKIEFENIDLYFRKVKRDLRPFGGIIVVVVGDFGQLEPIFDDDLPEELYLKGFIYYSEVWNKFKSFTLLQNMRQSDEIFIKHLSSIRGGENVDFMYWNNFIKRNKVDIPDDTLYIMSTNKEVDAYNLSKVCNLINKSSDERTVQLHTNWCNSKYGKGDIIYPFGTDNRLANNLTIIKGTRIILTFNSVMCIPTYSNNQIVNMPKYYNGQLCTIDKIPEYENGPLHLIDDNGDAFDIYPMTIKVYTQQKNVIKAYTGYSCSYAWAVTIHKIQGITATNLAVSPDNIFAKGQLYVALSRVRDSKGLHLLSPITNKHIIPSDLNVQLQELTIHEMELPI